VLCGSAFFAVGFDCEHDIDAIATIINGGPA
jgi:hypothetical protein